MIDFEVILGSILGPILEVKLIKIVKNSIWSDSKSLKTLNTLLDGFQPRFFMDLGAILELFLSVFLMLFGGRRNMHVNLIFNLFSNDFRTSSLK